MVGYQSETLKSESSAPSVSVVLPIYNAASFLREALDSLLAQTFCDFEAICVNDGSIDESLDILQEYAAKDSRIRILDGPNGGYGKAMNRGMSAATGKYLAILEPDDVLPEKAYEILYSLAEEYQLDIAKGCVSRFVDKAGKRDFYETSRFRAETRNRIICPRMEQEVYTLNMNTWTCLYRLNFLRTYNIVHHESPGASYQDNGLFFLSFSYANRLMCTNAVVYYCRRDNPNSSVHAMANKPYAMRDEYAYIRKKLEATPEIWMQVKPVYLRKRIDNHLFTYSRIRDSIKLAYLEDLRQELIELEDFSRCLLTEKQKQVVRCILMSPIVYLIKSEVELSHPVLYTNAGHSNVASGGFTAGKIKTAAGARLPHKKELRVFGIPVWSKNTKTGRCVYRLFGIRIRHKKITNQ